LEKSLKQKRRSQLAIALIVIAALVGVLVIRTDRVSADGNSALTYISKQTTEPAQQTEPPSYFDSQLPPMFKLGSALVIVLISIYGGIFLLKKMMGRKYSGNRQHELLEILETTFVAPKKSVTLLRVADKSVLIGTTETNISVLTELDSAKTKEILAQIQSEPVGESFTGMFKSAAERIREMRVGKPGKAALEG
jgi:flagellar biogenesis protein FliO